MFYKYIRNEKINFENVKQNNDQKKFDIIIISDENGNKNLTNDIARHIIKIDENTNSDEQDDDIFNTSFVERSLLSLSSNYGRYSKSLNEIYSQDIPQNSFMTQARNVSIQHATYIYQIKFCIHHISC